MSLIIQNCILILVFFSALFYLGKMVVAKFSTQNNGCASCAGACSNIDISKIEAEIRKSGKI